jgi:hypothetical protein
LWQRISPGENGRHLCGGFFFARVSSDFLLGAGGTLTESNLRSMARTGTRSFVTKHQLRPHSGIACDPLCYFIPRHPEERNQCRVSRLTLRESLRRQLEKAAARNQNSINVEIANQLHASFQADNTRALDEIVTDLDGIRRGFASLLGTDKLATDPEALNQTIALLETLRGRIVSPSSSSEPRASTIISNAVGRGVTFEGQGPPPRPAPKDQN